ncbi:aldose epimerase family protein [Paucilactobacillus sp. N302-9]
MDISKRSFGHINNEQVEEYTLTNDNNVSISILTFAGLWRSFEVPTTNGHDNLLLSAADLENYTNNPFYIGRSIGRIAGRLKNGSFTLNGLSFQVNQNEGNNSLHGGENGFSSQIWHAETKTNPDSLQLILTKTMTQAMDQFPGNMATTITYTLQNDNAVIIDFTATSDEDTLFNPTSHAYWNLGDTSTTKILNHTLQLRSDRHLEVDNEKMPTGNFLANKNTPFDFSQPTLLSGAIDQMKNTTEKGFDDILEINPSQTDPIAILHDTKTDRSLKIYSNRNALIVFTANSFEETMHLNRGNGHPYEAIALEAQTLSDTPHHPEFGDVTLVANQPKSYQIKYEIEF